MTKSTAQETATVLTSGPYNPKEIEAKWTEYWFENYLFYLDLDPEKPRFSIALPPPNITGNLHMGHALNGTLQDLLIRLKRMQGYNVLWQPGTDHAGISTQMVVERQLRKEHDEAQKNAEKKKPFSRHELGREKFIEKVWQWRNQYGDQIMNQYKRLGVSFNWDRVAFTMDDDYVRAIYKVFVMLYADGQIYRGHRVTNWCPRCLTSLSDLEVEHEEKKGHLYHIKYPVVDGSGFIVVATTRPESMFGDVAVAVHPDDDRYKDFIGKMVHLPLAGRDLQVIADQYVDREFGTGALKITPAHDANDWEVGQRHSLPSPVAIDETGKLMDNDYVPMQFRKLDRFKAREEVVKELTENGYLEEIKDYVHGVGHCERCQTVIEPYLSEQWYLSMKELAGPAITAVEDERVQFVPQRYAATYLDWMRKIRDWNISRQLWWGHRIPVWTCDKGHEGAYEVAPEKCAACGSTELKQDEDVLDTWFSSALWPFATLGWPNKTKELDYFYPTTVLSTAREIINLWVARMIFMSMRFMGTIPFKHVLIHPVIQTHDGKRMSKSKGNAIDPIDMIEKYGADANRYWFTSMGVKGDQDVRFREEKLEEYKRFVNKLWNAGKLVLAQMDGFKPRGFNDGELTLADRFILHRYNTMLERVTEAFNHYDFDDVARDMHEFIWDYFCDWYLEIAKIQLANEEKNGKPGETRAVLHTIYEGMMRALHPIMPFVTEELWSHFPKSGALKELDSIMFAPYPQGNPNYKDEEAERQMSHLMRVIRAIRNIRQTFEVPAKTEAEVVIAVDDAKEKELIESNLESIKKLASANPVTICGGADKPVGKAAFELISETTVYVPLEKLIDVEKTREKLQQRMSSKEKDCQRARDLLKDANFKAKAPPEKVAAQEATLADLEKQVASIQAQMDILKS